MLEVRRLVRRQDIASPMGLAANLESLQQRFSRTLNRRRSYDGAGSLYAL